MTRVTCMRATVQRKQSWLALHTWGTQRRYFGRSRGLSVTFLLKRGVPSLRKKLASNPWDNRHLKNLRAAYACCRAADTPRRTAFSGRQNCSLRRNGQGGRKATRERIETKLSLLSLGKQWSGSAMQKRSQHSFPTKSTFS